MQRTVSKPIPRGSDDGHLEVVAKRCLESSGYYALRRISCTLDGKTLRLDGRVSSYYEKQVAQNLILKQLGEDVTLANQLKVIASDR